MLTYVGEIFDGEVILGAFGQSKGGRKVMGHGGT